MAGFRASSSEEVTRVAITRYLQLSSEGRTDLSSLDHFCGRVPASFSAEETKDVELMYNLLVSAEKIGSQQFDRASIFLDQCDRFSSKDGTPVQRIVHYFAEALQEKLYQETGIITSKGVKEKETLLLHPEEKVMNLWPSLIVCYLELPFYQASQFAGMQAIIESVASAKRVHFIDLEIRTGAQCMVLIQALASQHEPPLEHLTVTAVQHRSRKSRRQVKDWPALLRP